jgi:hypothetical protein
MTLAEKVFEFECEVSFEEFALEVKKDIDKLETLKDVKEYYLYERGWKGDSSLEDLLFDLIIDLSTSTPTQN